MYQFAVMTNNETLIRGYAGTRVREWILTIGHGLALALAQTVSSGLNIGP